MKTSAIKQKNIDMTVGILWSKILIYFIPILGTTIVSRLLHAMDIAVIGNFAGTLELAAVGASGPIISIFGGLVGGLSVGISIVIGQLVGAGKDKTARKAMHNAVMFALFCGIVVSVGAGLFAKPLLRLTGTPEEIMEMSRTYMVIVFSSKPFEYIFFIGDAISRSKGDSKTPFVCALIGGVINLILNIIFVAAFRMSIAGVGISTAISHVIMCLIMMFRLFTDEERFRLRFCDFKFDKYIASRIVKLSVPSAFQSLLTPVSTTILVSAYNSLGTKYVAANSVSSLLEGLCFSVTAAFTATAAAFVSQNYGAKKLDRCRNTVILTITFSTLFTYLFDILILSFKNYTIGFITSDQFVIDLVAKRLLFIAFGHFFLIVVDQLASSLRGFGKPGHSSTVSIVGICGLRILWVIFVFGHFKTFDSIIYVYPITFFVTSVAMSTLYFKAYNEIKKDFAKRIEK